VRKARGRSGSRTNAALAQWLRLLCQTARYVKAPIGRFTPQTLPGRGGLDARPGLPYVALRAAPGFESARAGDSGS
jgi:hypothetical protein